MIFKMKGLLILFIDPYDCILADSDVNEQMQNNDRGKHYLEIDFIDTHQNALHDNKKFRTCTFSNQNLNESITSIGNQNNIKSLDDTVWLTTFSRNYFKKTDTSAVTQNSSESDQNIQPIIINESKDSVNDLDMIVPLMMDGISHPERGVITLPNEMQSTSNVIEYINNQQSIQNINGQEYNTCNDMYVNKENSDRVSIKSMTAEDIETILNLFEYNNIEVDPLNLQIEGPSDDQNYFLSDKIIPFSGGKDETLYTQITDTVDNRNTPKTNMCSEVIDDRWVINLNEAENAIYTESECININEILKDKHAPTKDRPEELNDFVSLLIEESLIPGNNEEPENNKQPFSTPYFIMFENSDSESPKFEKDVQTSPSLNDCELPTLDITQIEEIHELTPLCEENYFNQEDDNPKIITVPATENLPCRNREVNTSLKNHNIFTTRILTEFADDNKIYKEASMKYCDFTVLRERIDGNAEKIFKEVSYSFFLENSNECHSTRNKSKKVSKEQMELQINSKLRELYFDKKICVNLFSINEKYKEEICKFGFISPKIKNIPQISLEKYSINCVCGENTNFKHDIYYFSNIPLFMYPLILLNAHVRSWSVKRLYHSSMFNFILIICLEKKFLDPIQVVWETFNIEKKPKKYTRLFLLRLKTLYIPIFERNPSNKISSLNLNPPVIQTSDFRVTKKYISLEDFLKKRYGELISTIKEYKDLIPRVIDEEPLRNNIEKMLKYAESFYGNYKEISNYLNMPGNDTQEGLLLLMNMAESINSCKFHLRLRKDFSNEEIELMSFCDALKTSVANFLKRNTLHLKNP